jgi:hypothetical protein
MGRQNPIGLLVDADLKGLWVAVVEEKGPPLEGGPYRCKRVLSFRRQPKWLAAGRGRVNGVN